MTLDTINYLADREIWPTDQAFPDATRVDIPEYLTWRPEDTMVITYFIGVGPTELKHRAASYAKAKADVLTRHKEILHSKRLSNTTGERAWFRVYKPGCGRKVAA